LFDYVTAKSYGVDGNEGVCFGFAVHQRSESDYELELFFNDYWQDEALPNQMDDPADPTSKIPRTDAYNLYTQNGYATLSNWVANTILKTVTGNPDAQMVTTLVPMKMPQTETDFFPLIVEGVLPFLM
jgi:hypothetical protein